MEYRYPPQPEHKTMLEELRERVPMLHPLAALALTLEPMLLREDISSEQYLQFTAALLLAHNRALFSAN
jgi:hypothetical protein